MSASEQKTFSIVIKAINVSRGTCNLYTAFHKKGFDRKALI